MTKTCSKCGNEKEETEFRIRAYVRKDGQRSRGARCNSCLREDETSPARAARERERQLRLKYGLTAETFDSMLAAQGGRCANTGCKASAPGWSYDVFHVDHDHLTGKVRGLLCNACNVSLGRLGDGYDNDRIFGLYEYAVSHAPKLVGGPDALFVLMPVQERVAA